MLAMDVVDTLRHHRSIVETELNEEARERALIERVRSIYENQGIDVPDEVIRKGVEALKADRFTYKPPERTFAVRLAGIYVRRGKIAKVGAILLALAGGAWGTIAYGNHKRDKALVQGFAARLDDHAQRERSVEARLDETSRQLDAIGADARPAQIHVIAANARDLLRQTRERVTAWQAKREALSAQAYPDHRDRLDKRLTARRTFLKAVEGDAQKLGTQLAEITGLRRAFRAGEAAQADVAAGLKRVDVLIRALPELAPDIIAEVQHLRDGAQTNLDAGRVGDAKSQLRELNWLLGVLDQAYELRIVSRRGEKSGMARIPPGQTRVTNFYIIVEAVGPDGRVRALEFKNEEDQSIVKSRRIAIRVPQAVYQAVKADKVDNGIVDKNVFGSKRRGQRGPTYHFETAGGWIQGER